MTTGRARTAVSAGALAVVIAVTLGQPRSSSGESNPDAITVVLTREYILDLPAPGAPYARAVVTITPPRRRADGRFESRIQVGQIDFPERQGSFFNLYIGSTVSGDSRTWSCSNRRCRQPSRWIYTSQDITQMRRYGASLMANISPPTNFIWSEEGARDPMRKLIRKR